MFLNTGRMVQYRESRLLIEAGFIHGFTTRIGGVSHPPYDSLNLGDKTGDFPEAVKENKNLLAKEIGVGVDRWITLRQVHSAVVVNSDTPFKTLPEADSVITNRSGVIAAVKVADCLPVLIADPVEKVVASVHCGWKGLSSGIIEKTLNAMNISYGSKPGNLIAALGPCAGVCCYEIGKDIAGLFTKNSVSKRNGACYLDLDALACSLLTGAGLNENNIDSIGLCTICKAEHFYSYRRDREASGRMMAFIGIL